MCKQVEVIDDMVQKICQQIRSLNFTAVSDDEKKECKKRNLIKEELVFTRHYFQMIEFFFNAYMCSMAYAVVSGHSSVFCHVTLVYCIKIDNSMFCSQYWIRAHVDSSLHEKMQFLGFLFCQLGHKYCTMSGKGATIFLPLTLPNADWFSKFFHHRHSCKFIENIPPYFKCVTTLPCETSEKQ